MELIPKILLNLSRFSVLIPLFLLLRTNSMFFNRFLKIIGLLLLVAAASDLICYILFKRGISNIEVGNVYIIIQFYLLTYLYYFFLKNTGLFYTSLIIFTGFILINTLFIQSFTQFQSWPRALAGTLLIVQGVICHLQLHRNPPEDDRMCLMIVWINLGVLFYFSLNLYLFMMSSYIFSNESVDTAMITWSFHNVFNIIKNLLFAMGIYYAGLKEVKI